MSVLEVVVCLGCGAEFRPNRQDQRCCSATCRKRLSRREKCDTVLPPDESVTRTPAQPSGGGNRVSTGDRLVRVWGPNRLSEIELRVMHLEPAGRAFPGGAFYREITP
jgi:hypothetical protein